MLGRIRVLLTIISAAAGSAFGHSGTVNWSKWTFDWEVKDGAGIALRNVRFGGELFLYKGSMPVIRVKYLRDQGDDGCGPYADQIDWGNLVDISNCGNGKVCQRTFVANNKRWLELGVMAQIGRYLLYQVWYLSEDGWITTRMFSKGLHCTMDHNHHPYWRLDFDINGASNDQVFVFDSNRGNEGWGPGWHQHTNEVNELKSPSTTRKWFVRDKSNRHGVWVFPTPEDGPANFFSTKDAAARRYNAQEDTGWQFGATGHLGFDNGESVAEQDVIFWYVSHLYHDAADGPDQWHFVGPTLKVSR